MSKTWVRITKFGFSQEKCDELVAEQIRKLSKEYKWIHRLINSGFDGIFKHFHNVCVYPHNNIFGQFPPYKNI